MRSTVTPPEASEPAGGSFGSAVDTLAAMGFSRELAQEALRATGGDVARAAAYCVGDGGGPFDDGAPGGESGPTGSALAAGFLAMPDSRDGVLSDAGAECHSDSQLLAGGPGDDEDGDAAPVARERQLDDELADAQLVSVLQAIPRDALLQAMELFKACPADAAAALAAYAPELPELVAGAEGTFVEAMCGGVPTLFEAPALGGPGDDEDG